MELGEKIFLGVLGIIAVLAWIGLCGALQASLGLSDNFAFFITVLPLIITFFYSIL